MLILLETQQACHADTNLTGPKYGIRWLEGYNLGIVPFTELDAGDIRDLYTYVQNFG